MENPSIYLHLASAQAEFKNIRQDQKASAFGSGKGYMYADINNVLETIRPILNNHGLALIQNVFTPAEGYQKAVCVETIIYSDTGECIKSGVFTASTEGLQQKGVQALGSAITYVKRYQLMALLGIAYGENDDDGATTIQSEVEADKNSALLADADYYAQQGRDAFTAFWKTTTKEERAILKPHLDRLTAPWKGKPSAQEEA